MDTATLFSLEGRSALVTGGSRGIGRMIAEGLVRQGARVYLTARKADACDEAAAALSEHGTCVSLPGDVATADGRAAVVGRLRDHEADLDVLVNNAGAAWEAPFEEFPEAGWDKVMDVNLKALFFLTQTLAPDLRAAHRRSGAPSKVVNIASIDGISTNALETYSYHASKAGVLHLTKRLALRLVDDGIVVNGIAPGPFASRMNVAARDHADEVATIVPAGRVGRPEDIAAAAIYLAARSGDYVVGSTITVDGGCTHAR